jgi:LysM domain
MSPVRPRIVTAFIIMVFFALAPGLAGAETVELNPDHPDRYTVQKGDTLWDISAKFLKSPWNWPKIWRVNEQIKNPHLIYPGDVILLRWVNGQPELTLLRKETVAPPPPGEQAAPTAPPPPGLETTKLSPRIHVEPIESAIPTIPPDAIGPLLTHALVVGKRELDRAGYVTEGLDNRIALGNGSEFYARGLKNDADQQYFEIFRPGKPLRNPVTHELLAYEAIYLGDAQLLTPGDPAKLVVTTVKQEISPADRLLAMTPKIAVPYYFPHPPTDNVKGYVVGALNAVEEVGQYATVTITLGQRDGMDEGTVLRVMFRGGKATDPVTSRKYKLPDEQSGLVMVVRAFEKVSYALVMNATQPVHIGDMVVTP